MDGNAETPEVAAPGHEPAAESGSGSRLTRLLTPLVLALLVITTIGCDQGTKHLAWRTLTGTPQSFLADTLRLDYVENTGGFLSLGADLPLATRTAIFIVGNSLLLLALVAVGIRQRWSGLSLLGLTLFAAGGLSNLVDRIVHGKVVDFMNIGIGPLRTGIFNVADMAITAGVVLVIIASARSKSKAQP
jgi:signal peptidase II